MERRPREAEDIAPRAVRLADNYARCVQDRSTREDVSGEIQALLREQGIEHRSNSRIKSRIWMLEQSVGHVLGILWRREYGNLTTLDSCAMGREDLHPEHLSAVPRAGADHEGGYKFPND